MAEAFLNMMYTYLHVVLKVFQPYVHAEKGKMTTTKSHLKCVWSMCMHIQTSMRTQSLVETRVSWVFYIHLGHLLVTFNVVRMTNVWVGVYDVCMHVWSGSFHLLAWHFHWAGLSGRLRYRKHWGQLMFSCTPYGLGLFTLSYLFDEILSGFAQVSQMVFSPLLFNTEEE